MKMRLVLIAAALPVACAGGAVWNSMNGAAETRHGAGAARAGAAAPAQQPEMGQSMTLAQAHQVMAGALEAARQRSAGGAIAIVDSGGHLLLFERIDGTFPAGATVSIGKARTAATFRKPTKVFEDAINKGRIALTAVSEMTPLQGGVPIVTGGVVVGGIGVSGAHSQVEDEEIAIAGASAIK